MMQPDTMPTQLRWDHAARGIPEVGLSRERAADPDELASIARALDLVACRSLAAKYTITPTAEGRYQLSGTLRAEVEQACVVTLEPIGSTVEERFDVSFWPTDEMPPPASGEVNLDEELDPEPIVEGQIAVGRIVFEHLATAIEPFPRKPDATLERTSTATEERTGDKPESPFAVLANIRPKG
jgi:uncharacterized metal-binding protein YceD (DUF177 family)